MTEISHFQKTYSLAEYLDFEEKALEKHEFDNGKIIPIMAGGTLEHAKIAARFIAALTFALEKMGKDYSIFSSDVRVFLPVLSQSVYPDVACAMEDEENFDEKRLLLTNPVLIAEVLSESTAEYDRGEKFEKYSTLASFQEYVLISQNEPRIEVFYLHDPANNLWKISRASGLEASIELRSVGCTLFLKDIFRGIHFQKTPPLVG